MEIFISLFFELLLIYFSYSMSSYWFFKQSLKYSRDYNYSFYFKIAYLKIFEFYQHACCSRLFIEFLRNDRNKVIIIFSFYFVIWFSLLLVFYFINVFIYYILFLFLLLNFFLLWFLFICYTYTYYVDLQASGADYIVIDGKLRLEAPSRKETDLVSFINKDGIEYNKMDITDLLEKIIQTREFLIILSACFYNLVIIININLFIILLVFCILIKSCIFFI